MHHSTVDGVKVHVPKDGYGVRGRERRAGGSALSLVVGQYPGWLSVKGSRTSCDHGGSQNKNNIIKTRKRRNEIDSHGSHVGVRRPPSCPRGCWLRPRRMISAWEAGKTIALWKNFLPKILSLANTQLKAVTYQTLWNTNYNMLIILLLLTSSTP